MSQMSCFQTSCWNDELQVVSKDQAQFIFSVRLLKSVNLEREWGVYSFHTVYAVSICLRNTQH